MVDTAWIEAMEADVVLLLVDTGKGVDEQVDAILDRLAGGVRGPVALALNKIDRVRKDRLLELTAQLSARVNFAQVFMISALTGDGVDDLRAWLADAMPPGPWLYPEDQIADAPMRVMAAEVTREKVFLRLHDELPYESTVETTDFKRLKDGSIRIEQVIYVARASQKKIVLGAGGRTIKQISTEARAELSEQLGVPVHLFLFVKVRERWAEDPFAVSCDWAGVSQTVAPGCGQSIMQWTDEGIVLSVRPHGETAAIAELADARPRPASRAGAWRALAAAAPCVAAWERGARGVAGAAAGASGRDERGAAGVSRRAGDGRPAGAAGPEFGVLAGAAVARARSASGRL